MALLRFGSATLDNLGLPSDRSPRVAGSGRSDSGPVLPICRAAPEVRQQMTIAELFQYLLFGVVLGLGSALQSLWRAQTGDTTARQPAEETFEARLAAICRLERVDDLDQLLQSLTERYTSIVAAFTAGDLTGCSEDLSPEDAVAFAAAIAARGEAGGAGETPRGRVAVSSARIVGVRLDAEAASLEVAFTGLVAAGDGRGTVSASLDIWTFERALARHHSHWRVVATEPIG
jgi:hypothetical protein